MPGDNADGDQHVDDFPVVGVSLGWIVHGLNVQTEAVADLGAMACMLRIAAKTAGFDYDAFFRAFVKPFCIKSPENKVEEDAWRDDHPLCHLRVNVVAAQFPEFQETFGIRPGDGMYVAPEDRIAIWGMPDNMAQ